MEEAQQNPSMNSALGSVMRWPVVTLQPDDSAHCALQAARAHGVHHFPICSGGRLLGVICTCDLADVSLQTRVGDVLKAAVALPVAASCRCAVRLMQAVDVGSVVVLDRRGNVCGMVTRRDLRTADEAAWRECRCTYCGTREHLHRREGALICAGCLERATEPQAFDSGGGD